MGMKSEDFKLNPDFAMKFDDLDENQITIDEFINFLNDMKKKGVDKNAKLYICGSSRFFFHYNSDKKYVCLDTESLPEDYEERTDPLVFPKYTRNTKKIHNNFRLDYENEEWKTANILGLKCEFSDIRINEKSIPKGKYFYEVASDDGCEDPVRIASHVGINFYGTIVSDYPLELDNEDQLWLEDGDLQIEW